MKYNTKSYAKYGYNKMRYSLQNGTKQMSTGLKVHKTFDEGQFTKMIQMFVRNT